MRQSWKFLIRANFVLASLLLSACQDSFHEGFQEEAGGPVVVGITAGGAQTRTEMQANGLSAEWTAGDELAVWARNASGDLVLSNQIFKTYGIDSSRGFFTSTLSEAMPEDTYTYMCCYPAPLSVDGTKVTFNIPSVQDGKVSGGADVMIASPVQHGALGPVPDPEDHSGMNMTMNRMMHQFRFYIPEEDQILGEEKIERILLTFPTGVTGNVTLDLSDSSSPVEMSDAQADAELELAQPIGVSSGDDYQFACFAFAPVQFAEGQSLQIVKAYTDDKIAFFDPVDLRGKKCEPGHSTPVKLKIRELVDYPYQIHFTVSANNLGEGVNTIVFTAPEGCDWDGSGSNVYEYTPGHKINAGEIVSFYFDYHEEAAYRAFSGQDISITYDSDHALTYQTVNVGDVTGNDVATLSLTVPYLFFEDFAGLSSYDGDYKGGPYTSADGAATEARALAQYGLEGWTGARTGCDAAGTAILVGGRVDYVLLGATRAYGRLDSPALGSLKPGASTGIEVTFDYSGSKDGNSRFSHAAVVGTTTAAGLQNGYATQFDNNKSWSGVTSPIEIANIPTDGSATSMNLSMTSKFEDCSSATRLTWHVVAMGTGGISNSNVWLYVDNVKVKIAK